MPEISVIVPVYNVEKYLRRCVDSILNQTFSDFELILVDDGSTDGSAAICDEYAANSGGVNVVVVHQKNGGVSKARNAGLKSAKGEYITFVDSDDYIAKNYLECLYDTSVDFTVCNFCTEDSNNNKSPGWYKYTDGICDVNTDNIEKWVWNGWFGVMCGGLYRKDIIFKNSLVFSDQTCRMEDTIFNLEYIALCQNVKFIEDVLYNYVRHGKGSLTVLFSQTIIYSLDYSSKYLKAWFAAHNIVYEGVFGSAEMREGLFSLIQSKEMPLRQKYTLYKAVWKTDIFKCKKSEWFKHENLRTRLLFSMPSPVFLVMYEFIKKIIKTTG